MPLLLPSGLDTGMKLKPSEPMTVLQWTIDPVAEAHAVAQPDARMEHAVAADDDAGADGDVRQDDRAGADRAARPDTAQRADAGALADRRHRAQPRPPDGCRRHAPGRDRTGRSGWRSPCGRCRHRGSRRCRWAAASLAGISTAPARVPARWACASLDSATREVAAAPRRRRDGRCGRCRGRRRRKPSPKARWRCR